MDAKEEIIAQAANRLASDYHLSALDAGRIVREAVDAVIAKKDAEIERLQAWILDIQNGNYVNCVYCGHRYGPKDSTPVALAEVLKQHVQQCPKHPMAAMKRVLDFAVVVIAAWVTQGTLVAPAGVDPDVREWAIERLRQAGDVPGDTTSNGLSRQLIRMLTAMEE